MQWIATFTSQVVASWTPANWISFGTAAASFVLGIINLVVSGSRERKKGRREEFHRRIALPIEAALEEFRASVDLLHDLIDCADVSDAQLDEIVKLSKKAQRRLSKTLRTASESKFCSNGNWDVGTDEYDALISSIESARIFAPDNRKALLVKAIAALDEQEVAVQHRIHSEL